MSDAVPIEDPYRPGAPDTEGFQALERRVERLEGGRAADDDTPPDVGALADRLDRQRADIEELKRRYNTLARYVTDRLPAEPIATTEGTTDADSTTVSDS